MNRRRRGEVDYDLLWVAFLALALVDIVLILCLTYGEGQYKKDAQALKRQMLKCETCRKVLEQQAIDEALGDLKKEE